MSTSKKLTSKKLTSKKPASKKPTSKKPKEETRATLSVYPSREAVRAHQLGLNELDDQLLITLRFRSNLSAATKAALKRLVAEWETQVTRDGKRFSKEDGDDPVSPRFMGLDVSGAEAVFGGSRLVMAEPACVKLLSKLEKLPGLVRVEFGEAPDDQPLPDVPSLTPSAVPDIALPEPLEVFSDEPKLRICSPVFAIELYFDKPVQDVAKQVLACWEAFKELVPPAQLKWYANENSRKHQALGASLLGRLEQHLAPKATKREWVMFEVHDGADFNWAPSALFKVASHRDEDSDWSHLVRIAVPIQVGLARYEDMLALFKRLAGQRSVVSGGAGPGLLVSRYLETKGFRAAESLSLRYPTLDVFDDDRHVARTDAVRGAQWLTAMGPRNASRLGQAKAGGALTMERLGADVLLLRAGPQPVIARADDAALLEPYHRATQVLAPLLDARLGRVGNHERSWRFWSRFERWPAMEDVAAAANAFKDLQTMVHEGRHGSVDADGFMRRLREAVDLLARAERSNSADRAARAAAVKGPLEYNREYVFKAAAWTQSIEIMEQALDLPGAPPELYAQRNDYALAGLVPACIDAGQLERAEKHLTRALQWAPTTPTIFHAGARLAAIRGDDETALVRIRQAATAKYDVDRLKRDRVLEKLSRTRAFREALRG